jgi:hypothetical protein
MKMVRREHADADEGDENDDCVESHVIKYDGGVLVEDDIINYDNEDLAKCIDDMNIMKIDCKNIE